jgi:ATP-dependent DNA ligase
MKWRTVSSRGADFTRRYSQIVRAAQGLRATSALLDGEGIVYDQHGMPDFNLIHSKEYDREVSLVAFDLLELNGEDVRRNRSKNADGGSSSCSSPCA